jgi:hypothetical protein
MPLSVYKEDKMPKNESTNGSTVDKVFANNMSNCPQNEFMKHVYTLRHDVEEFVKLTGIARIRAEKTELTDDMTDEDQKKAITAHTHDKWDRILTACFGDNAEKTYEIMAKMCFTDVDVIKGLEPYELNNLALMLLSSPRINNFFTSLKLWGLVNTDIT